MDSWPEDYLAKMRVGGNGPARAWFRHYNLDQIPNKTARYGTSAAQAYKDKLRTLSLGQTWIDLTDSQMKLKYKPYGGAWSSNDVHDNALLEGWLDGATTGRRGRGSGATPAVSHAAVRKTGTASAPAPRTAPVKAKDELDEFFNFSSAGYYPVEREEEPKNDDIKDNKDNKEDQAEEDDELWGFSTPVTTPPPARQVEAVDDNSSRPLASSSSTKDAESSSTQPVAESSSTQGVTESSSTQAVAESSSAQPVAESSSTQSVVESSSAQPVVESSSTQGDAESSAPGVAEASSNQGVAESSSTTTTQSGAGEKEAGDEKEDKPAEGEGEKEVTKEEVSQ